MVDQGQSELNVVLPWSFATLTFYLVDNEAAIHKLSSNRFSEPVSLMSKPYCVK